MVSAFAISLTAVAPFLSGCASHADTPEPQRVALVAHPQPASGVTAEVYSGDVRARYQSQLGFRVAGKIKSRRVDVGAQVTVGQVLAELDPQDAQLQVASARAALASAEADAVMAKSENDRYQALLDKKFISQTQYDAKINALKAADAKVTEARSALSVAGNQSAYTTLKAEHAGVITSISAEVGQVVTAGQAIATLAHDGELEVEIAVPENRIGDYKSGSAVTVELWADAGKPITGLLREIAPEADRISRTYRVRVSLGQTDPAPRLGQTARVFFSDPTGVDLHLVPLAALYEQNGKPALWVVDPKTRQVHLTVVDVDAYREQGVALSGGVNRQQWIVTAGVHKLRDGQVIRPVDSANRAVSL
jgi:membrane fusion protein, multidrug efflux system